MYHLYLTKSLILKVGVLWKVNSFSLVQMIDSFTHQAGHTFDIVLIGVDQPTKVTIFVQPPIISDRSVIIMQSRVILKTKSFKFHLITPQFCSTCDEEILKNGWIKQYSGVSSPTLPESPRSWTSLSMGKSQRSTYLRPLFRPWHIAAERSTHPLPWLYGSMEEERPQTQCDDDGVHLAGLDSSFCYLCFDPDHCQ